MVTLVQLTDFHLRPPGVLFQDVVDTDAYTSAAIDAVLARHGEADAILVTGDLTDLGEEEAYARAAMLLSRFSCPVLVIPGNHDSTPALREAFSAWPGIADAPVAGKACHALRIGGVTVVSLDTAVDAPADGQRLGHGALGAQQLEWLDETLGAAGPAFVAMHHPPFKVGIGFMDEVGLDDREDFAKVIGAHDNVLRIVCGHVHRTIVSQVGGAPALAVPGVAHQVVLALEEGAAPAIVMEPPAYAVHQINGGSVVSHVGYVDAFPPLPTGHATIERAGGR